MRDDVRGNIKSMLSTIDAERSECYLPEDRDRIFEVVRNEVGFKKVNSMIFDQLRNWVITVTKERRVLMNQRLPLTFLYSYPTIDTHLHFTCILD